MKVRGCVTTQWRNSELFEALAGVVTLAEALSGSAPLSETGRVADRPPLLLERSVSMGQTTQRVESFPTLAPSNDMVPGHSRLGQALKDRGQGMCTSLCPAVSVTTFVGE